MSHSPAPPPDTPTGASAGSPPSAPLTSNPVGAPPTPAWWETEAGFRAVWEASGDAMALSDHDGIVLAANAAYYRLYGYGSAQVIGQSFAIIFAEELRPWAVAEYQQSFAQPDIAPTVESEVRRQDGTTVMVEVRYSFIERAGQRAAMLSTIRDITQRVRMQIALQDERRLTGAILSSTSEGIFGLDQNVCCTFINPAALAFLGYTAEECLGRNMHELTHYKHADGSPYPIDECPIHAAFYAGRPQRLMQEVLWHKDGHPLPALYSYAPLREEGGVIGGVVTIIDTAERVAILQRQREAETRAAEAVHVRDEVFSVVAHDLKNPLTAIKGLAQLLKRQMTQAQALERAPDGERLGQGLEQIDALATRMTTQINDLLDWARMETERPGPRQEAPTDLVALARRKVEEAQQATPKHRFMLASDVAELIGTWDPAHLERTLDNLLGNAIKYSPAGGTVEVRIAREVEAGRGWAVLSVQDPGIGIPAADLPHIFEWYRRARNVPPEIAGTGIGLAAVRQMVEQHGGTIAVASEEGAGATFTLRLPL